MWIVVVMVGMLGVGLSWGQGEEFRFSGGGYDGWARGAITNWHWPDNEVVLSLSSGQKQVLEYKVYGVTLRPITFAAIHPAGTIQEGGTIRLKVPMGQPCRFDSTVELTVGGSAAEKVGAPYYADDGSWLAFPVEEEFGDGDTLVIEGVRLVGIPWWKWYAGSVLEMDVDGDGITDVSDLYEIKVVGIWPGGAFDGWSVGGMDRYKTASLPGTVILVK